MDDDSGGLILSYVVLGFRVTHYLAFPLGVGVKIFRAAQGPFFFTWEAVWGQILDLDQLKRIGISMANRCHLCLEGEGIVDHLLHCIKTRLLWEHLFLFLGFCG